MSKLQLQLLVDDREREVHKYCRIPCINFIDYKPRRLTTGDFAIIEFNKEDKSEKILIIIERKTWKDLACSIKDGRIKNNQKLIDLREETGCRIVYIVEGQAFPNREAKVSRIKYKNLVSHIDHIALRDGFYIIHTQNPAKTAERIVELCRNYITIKENELNNGFMETQNQSNHCPVCNKDKENIKKEGGSDKSRIEQLLMSKKKKPDEVIECEILKGLHGVTFRSADVLYANGITIRKIFVGNITKAHLLGMRYSGGTRFSDKMAKKILSILNIYNKLLEDNPIKYKNYNTKSKKKSRVDARIAILNAIPGISRNTAVFILTKYTLKQIYEKEISKNTLSEIIPKNRKTRIGKKAAENIFKFLSKE